MEERAASAFQKTINAASSLPFEAGVAANPPEEGRVRLKGAFLIELSRIQPDPLQPRRQFDEQELSDLTASIRARGIMQPIRVWYVASENRYRIIAGERRFRAATAAGLKTVPCLVEDVPRTAAVLDGKEILVTQIVENWQRANLQPMETARALSRLRDDYGLSQVQISELTGKPKTEISKYIAMCDRIVPEVQEMAQSGEEGEAPLTGRHLYNLSKLKPAEQQDLAKRIKSERLTAMETERIVGERIGQVQTGRDKRGMAGRKQIYSTPLADVVITFRKAKFTTADLRTVVAEIQRQIDSGTSH